MPGSESKSRSRRQPFASFQFRPIPTATVRGTESSTADSIFVRTSSATSRACDSGQRRRRTPGMNDSTIPGRDQPCPTRSRMAPAAGPTIAANGLCRKLSDTQEIPVQKATNTIRKPTPYTMSSDPRPIALGSGVWLYLRYAPAEYDTNMVKSAVKVSARAARTGSRTRRLRRIVIVVTPSRALRAAVAGRRSGWLFQYSQFFTPMSRPDRPQPVSIRLRQVFSSNASSRPSWRSVQGWWERRSSSRNARPSAPCPRGRAPRPRLRPSVRPGRHAIRAGPEWKARFRTFHPPNGARVSRGPRRRPDPGLSTRSRRSRYLVGAKTSFGRLPPESTRQTLEIWPNDPETRGAERAAEKRTDVNIGIHMVDDAYQQRCDHEIVVSGDSDLGQRHAGCAGGGIREGVRGRQAGPYRQASRRLSASSSTRRGAFSTNVVLRLR